MLFKVVHCRFALVFGLLAPHAAVADSGHSIAEEVAQVQAWLKTRPRSLASCSEHLERRGYADESQERRRNLLKRARSELGLSENTITRRNLADLDTSHNFNLDLEGGFSNAIPDERTLFANQSNCVLQPEVGGLGHFIANKLFRSDIHERQPGIPMMLDIQLVNTRTCQPIPNTFIDIYQCNATGVYSGVVAQGNGNANDLSNAKSTFGRGMQKTDKNGIAHFRTIFPGHYYGVANHIHILTRNEANPLVPGPGGSHFVPATHNGRIFFDQQLISRIEGLEPYNINRQPLTLNRDDAVLNMEAQQTDPIVRYTMIGNRLEDGIFAWIRVGIDPHARHPMAYGDGSKGNGGSGTGGP